jgi:lipopolysaccharide transport system ATP-binding protein
MINKSFVTSPELSGLQAVKAHYLMLNGTMKGFSSFLEDVIAFSGLGDYIHLPIKGYSQGMVARLLFAVLTGIAHDCLALDEGIGAGDQRFVEAAQMRLDAFMAKAGTLFLASHSVDLLRRFCRRGLVFDSGRIVCDQPLEEALAYYHHHLTNP